MELTIKPRTSAGSAAKQSKRFPITLSLTAPTATVAALKQAIQSKSNLNVNRQRLTTTDRKVLDDDSKTLEEVGLKDGDELEIKDLGPQISWRTVFLVEYLGPILIHPIFYFAPKLIYGKTFEHSKMQKAALAIVLIHYLKREIETLFVHRFSSATMPAFNLVKNSAHYWILSGVLLSAPLYGPWNSALRLAGTLQSQDNWLYSCIGIWAFATISNAVTHLNLRSLRPAGTKVRQIPRGYGFSLVSCPNYLFEGIAWSAFVALTGDYAAALFLAMSAGQMLIWAQKKHARYRKEFGKAYPKGRKAMIPFIF